jgi:C-terminal processing protease CtpA/Prc
MSRLFALLAFLSVSCSISEAQTRIPRPFGSASVSRSEIAFSFAGDLWIVDRSGGEARRLTPSSGWKAYPIFSPDGSEIALSMYANGNLDVYVIPTSGGEPRRLTYHPGADFPCGWTPDGKAVLVTSYRAAQRRAEFRLLTIPAGGGMPAELPFPQASLGSFSPDGARIAYMPIPELLRRRYRGGLTSPILIGTLSDSPHLVTREDLNSVLREAFSHFSVSHLGIDGGDQPSASGQSKRVGLLGADYQIEQGKFRFARIYRGDNSTQKQLRAPLGQPGLHIKEGDYLLEVDGQELKVGDNLYRYFIGKADKPCQLRISATADWEQSRVVTVTPVADEYPLRHHDWVTTNRRKVDQLSGGRLACIYLPDTKETGYQIFNREFYAQLDKQGVIVDERFNDGGVAADYIIDILRRPTLYRMMSRESEDVSMPMGVIDGPRVMIINEFSFSGGDSLSFMFRAARLGTLVGKRTGGGALGGGGKNLLDDGRMTIPDWAHYDHAKGAWTAENIGVSPDIEVDISPADWRAGRDPQLERAVQVALEELQKNPRSNKRPKFPVYR